MPITEALKKLIKTITGKNAIGETIEELVQNLNDNYPEGGSGGDEYETVAEIAVGQMDEGDVGYHFVVDVETIPTISENETYYLNDSENASTIVGAVEDTSFIGFNLASLEHPTPIDTSKPVVAISFDSEDNQILVFSDPDLSNTTVKILKKVSGGGSITVDNALSDSSENPVQNKVVAAALENTSPLVVGFTPTSDTNATVSVAVENIYAAFNANKIVVAHYGIETFYLSRCYISNERYEMRFIGVNTESTATRVISCSSAGGTSVYFVMKDVSPSFVFPFTIEASEVVFDGTTPKTVIDALAQSPNVYAEWVLGMRKIRMRFMQDNDGKPNAICVAQTSVTQNEYSVLHLRANGTHDYDAWTWTVQKLANAT